MTRPTTPGPLHVAPLPDWSLCSRVLIGGTQTAHASQWLNSQSDPHLTGVVIKDEPHWAGSSHHPNHHQTVWLCVWEPVQGDPIARPPTPEKHQLAWQHKSRQLRALQAAHHHFTRTPRPSSATMAAQVRGRPTRLPIRRVVASPRAKPGQRWRPNVRFKTSHRLGCTDQLAPLHVPDVPI